MQGGQGNNYRSFQPNSRPSPPYDTVGSASSDYRPNSSGGNGHRQHMKSQHSVAGSDLPPPPPNHYSNAKEMQTPPISSARDPTAPPHASGMHPRPPASVSSTLNPSSAVFTPRGQHSSPDVSSGCVPSYSPDPAGAVNRNYDTRGSPHTNGQYHNRSRNSDWQAQQSHTNAGAGYANGQYGGRSHGHGPRGGRDDGHGYRQDGDFMQQGMQDGSRYDMGQDMSDCYNTSQHAPMNYDEMAMYQQGNVMSMVGVPAHPGLTNSMMMPMGINGAMGMGLNMMAYNAAYPNGFPLPAMPTVSQLYSYYNPNNMPPPLPPPIASPPLAFSVEGVPSGPDVVASSPPSIPIAPISIASPSPPTEPQDPPTFTQDAEKQPASGASKPTRTRILNKGLAEVEPRKRSPPESTAPTGGSMHPTVSLPSIADGVNSVAAPTGPDTAVILPSIRSPIAASSSIPSAVAASAAVSDHAPISQQTEEHKPADKAGDSGPASAVSSPQPGREQQRSISVDRKSSPRKTSPAPASEKSSTKIQAKPAWSAVASQPPTGPVSSAVGVAVKPSRADPELRLLARQSLSISILDMLMCIGYKEKLVDANKCLGNDANKGDNRRCNLMLEERIKNLVYRPDFNQLFPEEAYQVSTLFAKYTQRGIVNFTKVYCYINSVFQVLLACSPLMKILSHNGAGSQARPIYRALSQAASRFFAQYKGRESNLFVREENFIDPESDLQPILDRWKHVCEVNGQQDAGEFLLWLIDGLHEEAKWHTPKGSRTKSLQDTEGFTEVGKGGQKVEIRAHTVEWDSPIYRVFGCVIRQHFYKNGAVAPGQDALLTKASDEWFNIMHVTIKQEHNSLEDALSFYFSENESDSKEKMQYGIMRPPVIWIINLKRTQWDPLKKKQIKIKNAIKYDERLIIKQDWIAKSERVNYIQDGKFCGPEYNLFAVVGHHGTNADEGHYNAYVRYVNDNSNPSANCEWFSYDDTVVRKLTHQEWLKSQGAYLLLYIRPDVHVDIRPNKAGVVSNA